MDPNAFDTLARSFSAPGTRRRMLPAIAAVLGFGLAGASFRRTRAEQPEPCRYVYYTTEGRRLHGYGYADFPSPCTQCETSRDCETPFSLCLRDYISLVSGAHWDFVRKCGEYAVGVCGRVNACAPDQAQAGLAQ